MIVYVRSNLHFTAPVLPPLHAGLYNATLTKAIVLFQLYHNYCQLLHFIY